MKPFNVMKAAMMAALQLGLRFSRNPLEEIMAGRAIFHAMDDAVARNFDPRRWLQEFMIGSNNESPFLQGFERAPKRGAAVTVDVRARKQRRRAIERSRKGPNYAKLNRRGKLSAKHFKQLGNNAAFVTVARDALTGVVA